MKEWDVFISHASEDKAAVVLPLYARLQAAGLRVWLDRFELKIGDSLREKIDEGLAKSRYGVIVLSPSFLAKRWPAQELNGLFAREHDGRKVILPVWHELTKQQLVAYSPMIGDRLAANTADGMDAVARSIIDVVAQDEDSPSGVNPLPARRLVELLERVPEPVLVRDFLLAHPKILVGPHSPVRPPDIRPGPMLGEAAADLCVGVYEPTPSRWMWKLFVLHPIALAAFGPAGDPPASLRRCLDRIEKIRSWVTTNPTDASAVLPDLRGTFGAIVFAGRRDGLSTNDLAALDDLNDILVGTRVRTYDTLIDAATSNVRTD